MSCILLCRANGIEWVCDMLMLLLRIAVLSILGWRMGCSSVFISLLLFLSSVLLVEFEIVLGFLFLH